MTPSPRSTPGLNPPAWARARSATVCATGCFSRQRYWGEPFPIVYGEDGAPHLLPDSALPINLPDVPDYEPRTFDPMDAESNPEAPLSRNEDWVKVELDLGDGKKTYYRDTNTMPNWAGSCWYYMRYIDPSDTEHMVEKDEFDYWMGPNHNKYSGDEGRCGPVHRRR